MRKVERIFIEEDNRDKGKTFLVTEMSASAAEKWAARALLAMASSGIDIPDAAARAGLQGLARVGIEAIAGIAWEKAEPLLDEMNKCFSIQVDAFPLGRPLMEDDVEEVSTRLKLRMKWTEVQFGFSFGASPSISDSAPVQTS